MNADRKTLGSLVLLLLVVFSPMAGAPASSKEEGLKIGFCELVTNAANYDGRLVETEATLDIGFEWTNLGCAGCSEKLIVHADFENTKDIVRTGISNVRIVGVFQASGGRFGHFHLPMQIKVSKIKAARFLTKGGNLKRHPAECRCSCNNPR